MSQDDIGVSENMDDAVFKYLSATEMSPDLRNAVMSLMMELFEKEANETVGVLGESRLLFKAELTDYNLEQESLRHEARMHEERRQQEELEYQQMSRESKMKMREKGTTAEHVRPQSRTLAQIRNARVGNQSRNDGDLSSMSVRSDDGPSGTRSPRANNRVQRSLSQGDDDRPGSRDRRTAHSPFSTPTSGEPVISPEKLRQDSEMIFSEMQDAENKRLAEQKRQQEEIQKRREEKLAERNQEMQNQAKVILSRAREFSKISASAKVNNDLKLQARLNELKKSKISKMKSQVEIPVEEDLEEILI